MTSPVYHDMLTHIMNDITIKLTDQEKIFVEEYCSSLNKTLSYRKAFGETGKKNEATLANQIIERPHVYNQIQMQLQRSLDAEIAKSPNLLLKYIERYMELDPADYYEDDGRPKPMSELPVESRLLISNINKQSNPRTGAIIMTYVLPDKTKLLDKLSDLVKFVAQVRATLGDNLDMVGEAAKKRDEIFNKYKAKPVNSFKETDNEDTMRDV